eukprot:TRINITY_DN9586_c0_g1_i3.p1 TRINITY_DN9586_c0_g1~~TRINITY_DN9586_c0_g1_i3.p1  ORF type:complete len:247 (+),score=49.92 TRINITY_DN9586_c0_g1_i3:149-889(+)
MISKDKISLHESYCLRHLYRCTKCHEMVDKDTQAWHDEEAHTLFPCPYCSSEHDKFALQSHYAACLKKPKTCPYCELEVVRKKFAEHVVMCGSRTLDCPKCKKFVTKKDWTLHLVSGCYPSESKPSSKQEDQKYEESEKLKTHNKQTKEAQQISIDEEYAAVLMYEEMPTMNAMEYSTAPEYKMEQLIPSKKTRAKNKTPKLHIPLKRKVKKSQRNIQEQNDSAEFDKAVAESLQEVSHPREVDLQ